MISAVGVELLALGVLASSTPLALLGAGLLVLAAAVVLGSGVETVRRVVAGRRTPSSV